MSSRGTCGTAGGWITASRPDGQMTLAPFIFEQPRDTQDMIETAPVIEDSRPNTGAEPAAVAEPVTAPEADPRPQGALR